MVNLPNVPIIINRQKKSISNLNIIKTILDKILKKLLLENIPLKFNDLKIKLFIFLNL